MRIDSSGNMTINGSLKLKNETLEKITLISNNIDDFEPSVFDIKALEVGRNQVFAAISNKPEIWSYSEELMNNPATTENWANIVFDEVFNSLIQRKMLIKGAKPNL